MRNHPHPSHQQLLRSCLPCFLNFKALLLTLLQVVDAGNGASSCYTAVSDRTCTMFKNMSIFPFLPSQACGSTSSLVLSACSRAEPKPRWSNFGSATVAVNETLGLPWVVDWSQGPRYINISMNSSSKANISQYTITSGFINLTWSETLINQKACESRASRNKISAYLPHSIDLTSFAHSSFQFTTSNIILLFNCRKSPSSVPYKFNLGKNSSACSFYETGCKLPKNESSNCYQYIPEKMRELNVSVAMESLDCEDAMFFVVPQLSIPASKWSPGLIELNWSTLSNPSMDSNLKHCEVCLNSSGACGYDDTDNFRCYCANNMSSGANCTTDIGSNLTGGSIHIGCKGLSCNIPAKIVIGVVGTVLAISLILILIRIVVLQHCKSTRSLLKHNSFTISHLELDGLTERPTEYKYASIVRATEEFSNLIGEGGFGAVYKGTLGDATAHVHVQIAVKVLGVRSTHIKKQFLNEIASIGRIHHVHVVRLLGFCIEESHEMLVYEYVINGSLDKWLFHRSSSPNPGRVLLWEQRYAIAIGVARGLSYLHEECRHRIVHCDIKPQNILLDEQMRPKIADFGLARLVGREESQVTTLARGTLGYMGPEFWLGGGVGQLSTKSDVYSYGMVLLELISGQRNFGQDACFPELAFKAAVRGEFESVMDVKLGMARSSDGECITMDDMQRQQVQTAVLVALWCIQDHPRNRPSMSEVVQYLEGIAAINEQPPRPTIACRIISNSAQQHLCLSDDIRYGITPISGAR